MVLRLPQYRVWNDELKIKFFFALFCCLFSHSTTVSFQFFFYFFTFSSFRKQWIHWNSIDVRPSLLLLWKFSKDVLCHHFYLSVNYLFGEKKSLLYSGRLRSRTILIVFCICAYLCDMINTYSKLWVTVIIGGPNECSILYMNEMSDRSMCV